MLEKKNQERVSEQTRAREAEAIESDLDAWLGRVAQLKVHLANMQEKNIPELRFLTTTDWLNVTLSNDLQTDAKVRMALRNLRRLAKAKPVITQNFQTALQAYTKAHGGQAATDIGQLRPYLQPRIDDEILLRYKFVSEEPSQAGETAAMNGGGRGSLQEIIVVDEDYEILLKFPDTGRPGRAIRFARDNRAYHLQELWRYGDRA